ncbi:MAG: hypothetical protein ACRCV9_15670, partial [Burkholderiaceae bacterium]
MLLKFFAGLGLSFFAGLALAQVPVGAQIALDPATNNQTNAAVNVLRAVVTNAQGQPLPGVTVSWRDDPLFTASPLSGTVITDAAGVAQISYSANGPSGRLVITCLPAPDNAVCVVFTIIANAGGNNNTVPNQGQPLSAVVTPTAANSRFVLVSGNNQTGFAGVALAQPLVARLESVVGGAPVPNFLMQWITLDFQGTGSLTPVQNATTDANGLTQITFTPPNANAGRRVLANFLNSAGNLGPGGNADFTVNVQAAPTLACAPTYSVNPMTTGQAAALQGNCTVNGVAATAGTEQWTFPAAAGPVVNGTAATSATRVVGAAPLQVAFSNAGNFTPSLTFTFNGVTSAAINAPITVTPPPTVACAPTVSPTPVLSGQAFTINGNCTVNGVAATAGTETWSIPAIAGQAATTVTRVLPAAALQRTIAASGAYSFGLQFSSPSGDSPAYTVA